MAYRQEIYALGLALEVQQFVSARQFSMNWRAETSRLKFLKDKLGLRYAFHAPFMQVNFFSRSVERARASREAMTKALDVAAELEAEFVVVHSLFIPRRHNADYGADWPLRAPEFFGEVAREAAARGLTLAIENMLEKGPESILWLIEKIACPGTAVCLDVAHTAVAGGAPPADWVQGLGSALRHMHLSDNHGIHDDHLPLGDGTVDLRGALEAAAAAPQEVSLGLECKLRPPENVERSLRYLAGLEALGSLGPNLPGA
jgi:sugar phosphate isomerase/epimerase